MTWLIVLVFAALALTAAIYGGIWWLVQHLDQLGEPRAPVIHVAATVLPPIRSHRPVPGWPPAPVLEGRAVRGEVEK
jgi:hypothetical protein